MKIEHKMKLQINLFWKGNLRLFWNFANPSQEKKKCNIDIGELIVDEMIKKE